MSKFNTDPETIEDRIFIGFQHPGFEGPLEAIAAASTADPTPNPLADGGRETCSRCGDAPAAPGRFGHRCVDCIEREVGR